MKKNNVKPFITKFDIFVVLIALSALLALGVFIKLVLQKDTYITVELLATGGEWWWGTPPPYYWNADPVEKGSIEYDVFKKPLVEILDVAKYDHDNRKFMWIKARIKVRKNVLTNTYTFRQTQVQIGNMLNLAPNRITIFGHIVAIEGVGQLGQKKDLIVLAKMYSHYQWQADMIKIGDGVKNSKGEAIAEIIEKKVEPAEITTVNWLGDSLLRRDALMKDITLKIKMTVSNDGSQDFFMYYQPIQEGRAVDLQLINTTIEVIMTNIFPYSEEAAQKPL